MQLGNANAKIRPRDGWEAADLGIHMARKWWIPIYLTTAIMVIPVALTAIFIFPDNILLAMLVVWWLKPLYDNATLFVVSQSLFGETPTTSQTLAYTLRKILPSLPSLVSRLYDMRRSFALPVKQLEGLAGSARSQRIKTLGAGQGTGIALTTIFPLFELVITVGLLFMLVALNPYLEFFSANESFTQHLIRYYHEQYWLYITLFGFYALSIIIIEPLYVSAGFAQYINRRSYLEAWDIEIAFRHMMNRQKPSANNTGARRAVKNTSIAALACILFLSPFSSNTAYATGTNAIKTDRTQMTPAQVKQKIKKVMARKEFETKITYDQYYLRFKRGSGSMPNFSFGKIFQVLIWVLVIGGAVFFIVYLILYHSSFKSDEKQEKAAPPPESLFGLDLRPDSLPKQIVDAAKQEWQQGNHANAVSLLYRGALVKLINQLGLHLPESATEGECIRIVRKHSAKEISSYFTQLANSWLSIAYAHRMVEDNRFDNLCTGWSSAFGGSRL